MERCRYGCSAHLGLAPDELGPPDNASGALN
jgi:hypothetical protein